jgi:hypothetical protein
MLGFFIHAVTAPLYYGAKAASRAGRSSHRPRRARAPHYSHGYCTIAHRSQGAAQRCATSAAYRRVEAAGIAADRQREREATYREIARRAAVAEQRAMREARRQRRRQLWARHRNLMPSSEKVASSDTAGRRATQAQTLRGRSVRDDWRSGFAEWLPLVIGLGVVFALALLISAVSPGTPVPGPARATVAASTPTDTPPGQQASLCDSAYSSRTPSSGLPYPGYGGCWPGETVTVASFIDAATFVLTDGRHVRLAGIVVRSPKTCGGAGALKVAYEGTFGFKEGQQVNMIHEPNAGTDRFGAQWVYIQGNQGKWTDDLGHNLASSGYAEPLPNSGANAKYMDDLTQIVQTMKGFHIGQWGPPCGPPLPDSDSDPGPATDPGPSTHVDVDHHHHNLPDGLLTGGFCSHRRWC